MKYAKIRIAYRIHRAEYNVTLTREEYGDELETRELDKIAFLANSNAIIISVLRFVEGE